MGWLARIFGADRADPDRDAAKAEEVSTVLTESSRVLAEKDQVVAAARDRFADEFRRAEDAMQRKVRP